MKEYSKDHSMTEINFFYYAKKKIYFVVGKVQCTNCDKEIVGQCILREHFWYKKEAFYEFVCESCVSKKKIMRLGADGLRTSSLLQTVTDQGLPDGCVPTMLQPPELVTSHDMNLFAAAFGAGDKTTRIIDKTKWAGREQCEQINVGSRRLEIEQRIQELDSSASEDFVQKVAVAKPVLPARIENKEERKDADEKMVSEMQGSQQNPSV